MHQLIAYAEAADNSGSGLVLVVLSAGIILAVAGLAFVPVALAWKRKHRNSDAIGAVALLWGLLLAASVIYTSSVQMKWSREKLMRIESGYYDPQDNADAPRLPWMLWAGGAVVYAGLIGWATIGKVNSELSESPKE